MLVANLAHAYALGPAASRRAAAARLSMGTTSNDDSLLPFVALSTGESTAEVHLFGGCVTSYTKGGVEQLAHRLDSRLDGVKPISGGIPFCFPQFGPGVLQQHGFARNLDWEIAATTGGAAPSVELRLTENDYTLGMWPHAFECTYTVTLMPDRLATTFRVTNTGKSGFEFTAALHTYLAVSSVANVQLLGGFEDSEYLDKLDGLTRRAPAAALRIDGATDAVYQGVSGDVTLADAGNSGHAARQLTVRSGGGWSDTVLWNPYGNEAMGYDRFVCLESACALNAVRLAPQAEWAATMDIVPLGTFGAADAKPEATVGVTVGGSWGR